jgi:hypothetical protein
MIDNRSVTDVNEFGTEFLQDYNEWKEACENANRISALITGNVLSEKETLKKGEEH